MRLAVNVGFLFVELPYVERFLAVRAAGFDAVGSSGPMSRPRMSPGPSRTLGWASR